MSSPQGIAYFAGIRSLMSASYTLAHGITPGVISLYIAPQPGKIIEAGPVIFSYERTQIVLPDCKLDSINVEIGEDGTEIWGLSILDRRWKWKIGGKISGYYNTWRGSKHIGKLEALAEGAVAAGKKLAQDPSERTPRELATLCLEAMKEKKFDLSKMPNDARPEIEWDYALPAEALAKLCETVGCRVIMKWDGKVSIEPQGKGKELSPTGDTLSRTLTVDPPERPDKIVFVAARTEYQFDLPLEPVGLDKDSQIRLIDKLSYAPRPFGAPDWRNLDGPLFNNVRDIKCRDLAKKSVFRWYRIKVPIKLPWLKEPIESLSRIVPLGDKQILATIIEGKKEHLKPEVYGKFYEGGDSTTSTIEKITPDLFRHPEQVWRGGFDLDSDLAIVKFSDPVYQYVDPRTLRGIPREAIRVSGNAMVPADLRLRIAINVRDAKTLGWNREEIGRTVDSKNKSNFIRYIRRDDVAREYYIDPATGKHMDNVREVEKEGLHYINAAIAEYQNPLPCRMERAGLVKVEPDGAIQQVTLNIATSGFATTIINRNREDAILTLSFKEKRLAEKLKVLAAEGDKPARVKAEDLKKGKG